MTRPWLRTHKMQLVLEHARRRPAPRVDMLPRWAQRLEAVIRHLFPSWFYRREKARREYAALVAADAKRQADEAYMTKPPPLTQARVWRAVRDADPAGWKKWKW